MVYCIILIYMDQNNGITLAIVGTRTFNDYKLLKKKVDEINKKTKINLIISGGAKGADKLAEQYAKENKIPTKIFIPNWKKHNRAAGPIRNKLIIESSDKVIAFWDQISKGTLSSINLAKQMNKELVVINYK